jgi:hypothetical protein
MTRRITFLKAKLGFDNFFVADCRGRIGGLAFLWMTTIQLDIQNYSLRHINAVIKSKGLMGSES